MGDTIQGLIARIRERKRELDVEFRELSAAEDALLHILEPNVDSEAPIVAPLALGRVAEISVSNAVRGALRELGSATSADVIQYVKRQYIPDVNGNSIRSLLSVWATKGRIERHGEKYVLKKNTPEAAGTASGA